MPDPALLTPLGQSFRDSAPVVVRDDPDYLGVWHSTARELERLAAAVETVRAQLFPQTADVLLAAWEFLSRITVEPGGQTIEQRRATVMAMLLKSSASPAGSDWVANVTALVGAGWTYSEHIPGDPASPPEGTLRIHVPFAPDADLYMLTERLLRDITPAHLDIELTFAGGFVLDESQLDQEGLG